MQRLVEATLIKNILEKYQGRYDECQLQWDDNYKELQQTSDSDRRSFLLEGIVSLNAQLSAYECVIKDLKELIK
jgi:hypothetical protein